MLQNEKRYKHIGASREENYDGLSKRGWLVSASARLLIILRPSITVSDAPCRF